MNQNKLLFIQIQTPPTPPLSMHHKWKELLILYAQQPMKNHRGPTPVKESH
jgi:hypothetical protein